MEQVYKQMGITRQAIWKSKRRDQEVQDEEEKIVEQVKQWRKRHPKMGSRALFHSMKASDISIVVGINKFEKIIKERGLQVGKAKSRKPKSSDGKGKKNYPNLTNGLELSDINQLIVLDVSYIWIENQWYYIFAIKDAYSQRMTIVPSKDKGAKNALACLRKFAKLRGDNALNGCIHHSDNGSEYAWGPYLKALEEYNMLISRSKGCKENGSAEQAHNISKNMYLEPWGINTYEKLVKASKEFEYLNNNERAIKQLGNMTVHQFELSLKEIPKEQRMKRRLHDFQNNIRGGFEEA